MSTPSSSTSAKARLMSRPTSFLHLTRELRDEIYDSALVFPDRWPLSAQDDHLLGSTLETLERNYLDTTAMAVAGQKFFYGGDCLDIVFEAQTLYYEKNQFIVSALSLEYFLGGYNIHGEPTRINVAGWVTHLIVEMTIGPFTGDTAVTQDDLEEKGLDQQLAACAEQIRLLLPCSKLSYVCVYLTIHPKSKSELYHILGEVLKMCEELNVKLGKGLTFCNNTDFVEDVPWLDYRGRDRWRLASEDGARWNFQWQGGWAALEDLRKAFKRSTAH